MLNLAVRCALILGLFLAPSLASALTYNFTNGSVSLRAELAGTSTSVLDQPSPVVINLGGSFVEFDPLLGANGTLLDLELIPAGAFTLDLDQTVVGYDVIEVSNAMLVPDTGATAALSGAGSFNLDTVMSGDIEGVGGPPPLTSVSSLNSATGGSLFVSGTQLELAVFGVTLATFESLVTPNLFVDIKADFTFFGVVPEPGTGLLMGLGLAGLSAAGRRPKRA